MKIEQKKTVCYLRRDDIVLDMKTYAIVRNGAVLGCRDSLAVALDWLESKKASDAYMGEDRRIDCDWQDRGAVTYVVKEMTWDGNRWQPTYRDQSITIGPAQAWL